MRQCSLKECDAPRVALGLCMRHYQRWRRRKTLGSLLNLPKCKKCNRDRVGLTHPEISSKDRLCYEHLKEHRRDVYKLKRYGTIHIALRRRYSGPDCKYCGQPKWNGTDSTVCHPCYLEYTKARQDVFRMKQANGRAA